MGQEKTIKDLREGVIAEMVNRGYQLCTIRNFRYNCNRLERYVKDSGLPSQYTEAIGAAYLKDMFGYDEDAVPGTMSPYIMSNVKTISKLGEYKLYGTFHSEIASWTSGCDWAGDDRNLVEEFLGHESETDKSKNTIKTRRHSIRYFYEFLNARGLPGIRQVTGQIISEYVRSRNGNSNNYICTLLAGLKLYFRYLYQQGYCSENLEQLVPIIRSRRNLNVPALWSEDELQRLLTSIDRSSPAGKRDYAILLLAVQLGIRTSDIAALRLEHLNWERNTIEFVQHKTDKSVVYPLLSDIGWAIIDYIRYGRAEIENPYVFLTCFGTPAEFADGSAIGGILHRRMKLSGIRKESKNTSKGMHSLRHALARRLVENDTEIYDVVSIMGHRNTNATSKYARTDIKGLRECALSIGV